MKKKHAITITAVLAASMAMSFRCAYGHSGSLGTEYHQQVGGQRRHQRLS